MLMFNVYSADKKPGNGVMEYITDESLYTKLSKLDNWRKMLANEYIFDFEIDGSIWPTLDHYVVANNYKGDEQKYNSFKKDGSIVISKLKLKEYDIDVLEKALRVKFSKEPFQSILIETNDAILTHWRRGMNVLTTSKNERYVEPNTTCKILMDIRGSYEKPIIVVENECIIHQEVIVENENTKQLELKILSKKEIDEFDDFISKYDTSCNKSVNVLTKYEKTNIIGVRMEQLSMGGETYICQDLANELNCVKKIAHEEFIQNKIPYMLCRSMPNNVKEYWKLSDLIYVE